MIRAALLLALARAASACPSCAGQVPAVDTRWLLAAMIAAPVVVAVVVGAVVRRHVPRR